MPSSDAARIAAHSFSGALVYCSLKLRIARPSPNWLPPGFPSPTIAPTMLAVAATLSALNRYGSEAGMRSFQKIVQRDAAQLRISSRARGSGEVSPRSWAIATGKNVRYEATITMPKHAVPERERDERREGEDRDRLARHDIRHERPLGELGVDEAGGEREPEQRPEQEPEQRPPTGVDRGRRRGSRRGSAACWRWTGAASASAIFQMWGKARSLTIGHLNGGT